jgi:hypothetical protein
VLTMKKATGLVALRAIFCVRAERIVAVGGRCAAGIIVTSIILLGSLINTPTSIYAQTSGV